MTLFRLSKESQKTDKGLRDRTLVVGLGAMKAGTTWLGRYLSSHPDFFRSPVKEINFFNTLFPNPFENLGPRFRQWQMEEIILSEEYPPAKGKYDRLRALAQIGRMETPEDYISYFEERIADETHFGELSPHYSHLSAEAFRTISRLTDDVRFVFIMRDPTDRAVSHIRHLRRRLHRDQSIDDVISAIDEHHALYLKSDYGHTLDALEKSGLTDRTHLITFEDLFRDHTVRNFCDWLGIRYISPEFEKRVNATEGEALSADQKDRLRDVLDPIYRDMSAKLGSDRPTEWRW